MTQVELDSTVYRLEAIKKAAYRLGARCFARIEVVSPSRVRVSLEPRTPGEDLAQLAGELQNEALDQELREVVAKETEAVRNLILAQAFSKTTLLDAAGESADFRGDPLGIGRPDER